MDITLSEFNYQTCPIYSVDVTVFFKSFDAYLKNVDMVLSTLGKVGAFLNLMICCFVKDSMK